MSNSSKAALILASLAFPLPFACQAAVESFTRMEKSLRQKAGNALGLLKQTSLKLVFNEIRGWRVSR